MIFRNKEKELEKRIKKLENLTKIMLNDVDICTDVHNGMITLELHRIDEREYRRAPLPPNVTLSHAQVLDIMRQQFGTREEFEFLTQWLSNNNIDKLGLRNEFIKWKLSK